MSSWINSRVLSPLIFLRAVDEISSEEEFDGGKKGI